MEKEQAAAIPAESVKESGPSFGKFRNAEELLKAYNSLEGEFTKRSQKLREYEQKDAPTPKTDWESKVGGLLQKYPFAQGYTEEITQVISCDKSLLDSEDCLENALISVLQSKVKGKEEMASDTEVVELVLKSEGVRERVINDYLSSIRTEPVPKSFPKAGGAIPAAPFRASTLSEAAKLAQKYLEEI